MYTCFPEFISCVFIFIRIKQGEYQGKEKCHAKSMMSNEANERIKRETHHVPPRQNTEEKVRGKGLKAVWGTENERNETVV